MDAIKGNITSVLNGSKQFVIPVYQRTYSWEIEQCKRLWDDIVVMQTANRTGHFVGSIVNIAEQAMPTGIQKFMIIDGQQRLTTLTLLLIAIRDYGIDNPHDSTINHEQLNGTCIINIFSIGDEKYKLLLTQSDKEIFIKLVERSPIDTKIRSRLLENYNFFVDMLNKKQLNPAQVVEGIAKLQIVNITLDRVVDDAQLIFESLNSTGMDLSQSDLIRNYILMGLEPVKQENVYKNYWLPMEKLFDYEKQTLLMDRFFRDYLTYKIGRIPNMGKVYEEFKGYTFNNVCDIEKFCREIYICASHYTNMYYAKSEDNELDSIFSNIRGLQMDVALPFLLKVYDDYVNGIITKDEFCKILKLCESYVFRRAICGIPTNSMNKTFTTLIKQIAEDDYLNSFKAFLVMQETYKVFPSNESFVESFKIKDIYNMRIRNYILSKLENHNNKEPINIENYTIEHIMPQNSNLKPEWQECLGKNWREIQKEYLHTIGNLTLTCYNSELSDNPFGVKMSIIGGFKESALRCLNSFVVKQETWNENTIKERANELCELAKKIWEYPIISEENFAVYSLKEKENDEYTTDSYEHLNGEMLELFFAIDKRIQNISSDVKREFKKLYIAYKSETNFVDIVPQKNKLRLSVNMKYLEVIDLKGLCRDVTSKGRWGNGDVEIAFNNVNQLDDVMNIIIQSYKLQSD